MKTLARRDSSSNLSPWFGVPTALGGLGLGQWWGGLSMPKVEEKNGEITAHFAVPGLTKKDVAINYSDGYIEVEGSKNSDNETSELYMREYVGDIDANSAKAEVKEGLLTIHAHRANVQHRLPIKLE